MKIFEAHIPTKVLEFLNSNLKRVTAYHTANKKLYEFSGIKDFLENQDEYESLKDKMARKAGRVEESEREEYGDFQTNVHLTNQIASFLRNNSVSPKVLIEPTCGTGNFITASLSSFDRIEKIVGVEIYKPYVWETKFNILQFFIDNPSKKRPEIDVFHGSIFDFDFNKIVLRYPEKEVLIIGNPPWVTNSKLGSLDSSNLPHKSNFKKHSGLDAMTGKGNFDIGEFIALMMFEAFQNSKGHFAFLVKNAVVKNIVFDQRRRIYNISDLKMFSIDSKREFNVSVEASLLFCRLKRKPEFVCKEYDFRNPSDLRNVFGWSNDKFVSSVKLYEQSGSLDGICPFEWRQGIKHDLSSLMELEKVNGQYVNGNQEEVNIEDDLVFGILKSSDLKRIVIDKTRKFTIITQTKIGQDTGFIKEKYPRTYNYLQKHKSHFDLRKSSIYNGKPDFAIFGVGDYSFKPFKVAISGLYKNYYFNLVLPNEGKPIMLDDTCYFIGFDKLEFAVYTLALLNSERTKAFLQAITFSDAKRTFTKDVLMRIDLPSLVSTVSMRDFKKEIDKLNSENNLGITLDLWENYIEMLRPKYSKQLSMFPEREGQYRRKCHKMIEAL
jgi:hypothetical protein